MPPRKMMAVPLEIEHEVWNCNSRITAAAGLAPGTVPKLLIGPVPTMGTTKPVVTAAMLQETEADMLGLLYAVAAAIIDPRWRKALLMPDGAQPSAIFAPP